MTSGIRLFHDFVFQLIQDTNHGKNDDKSGNRHGPGDAEVHVSFKGKIPSEIHDGQYGGGNASYGEDCRLFPVGKEKKYACQISGYTGSGKHAVMIEDQGDYGKNECVFQMRNSFLQ